MKTLTTKHCPIAFETELGFMGLVASERGIAHVVLPLAKRADVIAALGAYATSENRDAGRVVAMLRAWARGERVDFSGVAIDLASATEFERAVYEATRAIPHGETRTYGEIARAIGRPGAARAVGAALGRNPVPPIVPCHRVVAAGGAMGGFSARGGITLKRALLQLESRA